MTMQLQSEANELFSISENEKTAIDKMFSIDVFDTKHFNPKYNIDHCIFKDKNGVICLIAHGNENMHKIWFNQQWRTMKEVAPLLRSELSIDYTDFIVCRVYCCHGGVIEGYYDTHNLFLSAFNNKPELKMFWNSASALFAYTNKNN